MRKRRIWLREWEAVEYELSLSELAQLRSIGAGIAVEPLAIQGRFRLTAREIVGAASASTIDVIIQPKIGVRRLFYLLGFSTEDPFVESVVDIGEEFGLSEAMAAAFSRSLAAALRRGLLNEYLEKEETGFELRGRIRYGDQIARRFGRPMPLEIQYDDYTVDSEQNRVLHTALRRCERMPLRRLGVRRQVRSLLQKFEGVGVLPSGYLPAAPMVTRLNRRFDAPTTLARLILRGMAVELAKGRHAVPGFLIDMNQLFEDFVYQALGRRLWAKGVLRQQWRQGEMIPLDTMRRLRAHPDFTGWSRGACAFVGDAKNKRTKQGELSDVYQLMAYCVASRLSAGMLIYAGDTAARSEHQIVSGGPRIVVRVIPISGDIGEIDAAIDDLAEEVLEGWISSARSMHGSEQASRLPLALER